MTQANDSILFTPGSGVNIATHTVASKEHQVMMRADSHGHIWDTQPTYYAQSGYLTTTTGGLAWMGFFYPSNATKVVVIKKIYIQLSTATFNTPAAVPFTFSRVTGATGVSGTTVTVAVADTTNPATSLSVACNGFTFTGSPVEDTWMEVRLIPEETNWQGQTSLYFNIQPDGQNIQEFTIRPGQGLAIRQTGVANPQSSWNVFVVYTEE